MGVEPTTTTLATLCSTTELHPLAQTGLAARSRLSFILYSKPPASQAQKAARAWPPIPVTPWSTPETNPLPTLSLRGRGVPSPPSLPGRGNGEGRSPSHREIGPGIVPDLGLSPSSPRLAPDESRPDLHQVRGQTPAPHSPLTNRNETPMLPPAGVKGTGAFRACRKMVVGRNDRPTSGRSRNHRGETP